MRMYPSDLAALEGPSATPVKLDRIIGDLYFLLESIATDDEENIFFREGSPRRGIFSCIRRAPENDMYHLSQDTRYDTGSLPKKLLIEPEEELATQ